MILPANSLSAKGWYDDDEEMSVSLAYAYPTTVELSLGYAGAPYQVNGDAGRAFGMMNGVSAFFRFTGMFTKHFGGFFQIGVSGGNASDLGYFGTLNRADGDKYRYGGEGPDFEYLPMLLAGPMVRFDFNRLSIRPRVGMGVTWFSTYENSYYRIGRDADYRTAPATYFHNYYSHPANDYLVENGSYSDNYFIPSFVVAPSLQLTYTPKTHFFLSFEAGYNIATRKMAKTIYRAESVDAYNPETFVEELYLSDRIGTWMEGPSSIVDKIEGRIADSFYLNFGIGWNIGHNRNQKGRYYHKY